MYLRHILLRKLRELLPLIFNARGAPPLGSLGYSLSRCFRTRHLRIRLQSLLFSYDCLTLEAHCYFPSKDPRGEPIVTNAKGYNLVGVLIATGLSTFILLGTSTYITALSKLEYKNASQFDRDLLVSEIKELMKNPLNCMESLKNATIDPHIGKVELIHLKEAYTTKHGDTEYKNKFELGGSFGERWIIDGLTLKSFQGEEFQNELSGFIGLNVTLSPTSQNYYNSEFIQVVPLRVSLKKHETNYRFTSCGFEQKNTTKSHQSLCRALSGVLVNGRCLNTNLPGGLRIRIANVSQRAQINSLTVDVVSTQKANIGSDGSGVDFLNSDNVPSGTLQVGRSVSANAIRSNQPWHRNNFSDKLCITESMNIHGEEFIFNDDDNDNTNNTPKAIDVANCPSGQYIKAIDPKSWTATCGKDTFHER